MIKTDEAAGRAFEESAVVRTIELGMVTLQSWAAGSVVAARVSAWLPIVRSRTGQVLVTTSLTHLALMVTIAHPPSWLWLILPSIAFTAGLVLIVTVPPGQRPR